MRLFRSGYGDLLRQAWPDLESLQAALDQRSVELMRRHTCPVRGGPVEAAWEAEKSRLQPVPELGEIFDLVVSRPVSPDCLVSFEGRRYSVPFAWVGRDVEVLGTAAHVVVHGGGTEIARHARRTEAQLLLDPAHFEGESTDRVIRPTPLAVAPSSGPRPLQPLAHAPGLGAVRGRAEPADGGVCTAGGGPRMSRAI